MLLSMFVCAYVPIIQAMGAHQSLGGGIYNNQPLTATHSTSQNKLVVVYSRVHSDEEISKKNHCTIKQIMLITY